MQTKRNQLDPCALKRMGELKCVLIYYSNDAICPSVLDFFHIPDFPHVNSGTRTLKKIKERNASNVLNK